MNIFRGEEMDIGRIIIFLIVTSICVYKYFKTRQTVYMFLIAFSWFGTLYMSGYNLYQYLPPLLRQIVNGISFALILTPVFLSFKKKIRNYRNID